MSPPWVDSLETGDRIKELSVRFGVTAGQDMNRRCCTFVRENVDFRGQPSEMLISGPRRSRRDRCWPVSAPWRPQGSCSCPDLRALRSGRRRRGCGRGGGGGGEGGGAWGRGKPVEEAGGEKENGSRSRLEGSAAPGRRVRRPPPGFAPARLRTHRALPAAGPAPKQGWGPRRRGRVSPSGRPAGAPGTRRPFLLGEG